MNILQIIAGLDIGAAHGGAEQFGAQLALALHRAGQTVELCAFWQHNTPTEQEHLRSLRAQGLPVFFAGRWQGRAHLPAYTRALRTAMRAWPADLVHSHFQLGSLAALLLKATHPATCATRTAHVTREWGSGAFSAILRAVFTGWVFPLGMDAEFAVSQAVLHRLQARPAARLARPPALIYNAISPGLFAPSPARCPGATLGFVGRLTAQKDAGLLLRALALLTPTNPNLRLLLAGDGPLRASLVQQSHALHIQDRVRFLGVCHDIPALLRQIDLLVLPSRWEGLPTVLLECAAAGVACIASDIPGTRELITDGVTGWLFPSGDAAALAQAIRQALDNPDECHRRAQRAAGQLPRFDLAAVTAQYLTAYRAILQNG